MPATSHESDEPDVLEYNPPRDGTTLGTVLDFTVLLVAAFGASACAAIALAAALYFLFAVGFDGLLMAIMCLCTAGGFIIASTNNWTRVHLIARGHRDGVIPPRRPKRRA